MNLIELSFEKQVNYLRSLMSAGKNSFLSYFALFAFRHHLAMKNSPNFSQKPVLRWYLGQLAKEYISKYFKEAKSNLENFADIGLLETEGEAYDKEFRLNEALYPALSDVLAEVFGEETISKEISRARYFKNRTKEVKE
ncbi:MAG: hypothetical protein ABIN18_22410 [Pseudomonadota bacterium]